MKIGISAPKLPQRQLTGCKFDFLSGTGNVMDLKTFHRTPEKAGVSHHRCLFLLPLDSLPPKSLLRHAVLHSPSTSTERTSTATSTGCNQWNP
ncbi:hypothetical protein TNIN_475781 [Trichonephila inaurata madagascariensis]|uniref:Uncharacterized protein n=1 Tax=Trichonephila inaurata madagascariensis TaxID=2747483 RepID=A0A8X6ML71_9ARAC|nr:hypothetical protein TNIN_475781 [Trichonephila inaurata madagascariensis]